MPRLNNDYNGADQFDHSSSPFNPSVPIRKNNRRNNISFDRTFDFFGFGGSSQQNNILNINTSNNNGLSGLFKTMNVGPDKSNNFNSAAEAMGMEIGGGLQRSNSIFGRSIGGITAYFHNRHNSANIDKKEKYFETEVDGKLDPLDSNKLPNQQTFDERRRKQEMTMNNTMDIPNKHNTSRRTNSMAFNLANNPFHFRRTISRIPTNTDRKKLSRQLSISMQKNVELIRRQSSLGNIIT